MALIPFIVILLGYQLGWYGYATLQQPVHGGCVGFTDLLLPSRISQVDQCITNNWGKSNSGPSTPPFNNNPSGGGATGNVTNPPGAIPSSPNTGPPAPTFQ